MNEHDRLVELYHTGDCELVFQLMDGLGLEWLDLGIDYLDHGGASFSIYTARSLQKVTIYWSLIEGGENDITIIDDESNSKGYCETGLTPVLKKLDMLHLTKYIIKDNNGYEAFSHDLPKEEFYKLIFKKV